MDSYNYYLFDLDGTISESAPGIVKAVKYGLDQAGIHEEDAEKLHSFIGPPLNVQMKKLYGMTDEQIEETWQAVRDSGNYPDIERTEASNGDVYYYSTQYLESGYAASLAEYDAVERPADV